MNKRSFVTKELLLGMAAAVAFNLAVYYGGRFLSESLPHRCLETELDRSIPLLPWMVFIYWAGYIYWLVSYAQGMTLEKGGRGRFLIAHLMGEAVCFLCFVLLPTTLARPAVSGHGPGAALLRLTYRLDSPDNLFPSIHCFASWLSWIGVRGDRRVPLRYRLLSLFMALAVCVSTLTVKQHVAADAAAGILLAELSYLAAGVITRRRAARRETAEVK